MIYVGLDLHKRYITACAIEALGQLLAEERRLASDLAGLLEWLGRLTGPVTVVLEATLYWAWLEQQLSTSSATLGRMPSRSVCRPFPGSAPSAPSSSKR